MQIGWEVYFVGKTYGDVDNSYRAGPKKTRKREEEETEKAVDVEGIYFL